MTLEAALAANTAALEKHTAVLENFISLAGTGKAAEKAPKTDKAEKSSKADKPKASKTNPWATEELFLKFVTDYLRSSEDKDEKKKAGAAVRPILDHFGVPKFSELPSEHWQECVGYIQKLKDAIAEDGFDALEDVDLGLSNETEDEDEDESPI